MGIECDIPRPSKCQRARASALPLKTLHSQRVVENIVKYCIHNTALITQITPNGERVPANCRTVKRHRVGLGCGLRAEFETLFGWAAYGNPTIPTLKGYKR